MPLVEVALTKPDGHGFRLWTLLDTGATVSLFPVGIADALDLDWASAPTCPVTGISGGPIEAHVLSVQVELCEATYRWKTDIAFLPGSLPFPLLGHHGFFEHFEVRFKTSQRRFRVHLR